MHFLHLGPAGDTFAGALGVTAALLLLGGSMVLRWQRNHHQFILAQAALAKGVTRFPKGPPFWLVSLRQGVMSLTLGASLLLVGGFGFWMTHGLAEPMTSTPRPFYQPTTQAVESVQQNVAVAAVPMSPGAGPAALPVPPQPPPPPNPALEEWHRLKSINTLVAATAAIGFVLMALGIVRIAFSRVERRHFVEDAVA